MFREGPIEGVIFKLAVMYEDQRGFLIELFRHDELAEENLPQMGYVSETLPGVARGPHEHRDQSDYFAFVGPGDFLLYLWDRRPDSATRGNRQRISVGQSNRQLVIVPPGVVHAYKNISDEPGWIFNCPNRLFRGPGRQSEVDEIRYEELDDHPYVLD